MPTEHLGLLIKNADSDSVGLAGVLLLCICDKLLRDVRATSPWTTFRARGSSIQTVSQHFHLVRLLKQNCFLLFQNAPVKKRHRWSDYKQPEQASYGCLSGLAQDILESRQASSRHRSKTSSILMTFSPFSWCSGLEWKEAHLTILSSKILLRRSCSFCGIPETNLLAPISIGWGLEYSCRRISLYPDIRKPFPFVPENPCVLVS